MNTEEYKFQNGDKVQDIITGYKGIIVVKASYATGCTHYGVLSQELDEKGKEKAWVWEDESRWELVPLEAVPLKSVRGGGPSPSGPNA